jgi:hypothetical protein
MPYLLMFSWQKNIIRQFFIEAVILIEMVVLDCVWNAMAHVQKADFVFRRNGRVHLNRRGCQFNRLLAAELCVSAVVMLDTPCSEVVWRVLATHSIRHFPLHFFSRASPCAVRFQMYSNTQWQILDNYWLINKLFNHRITSAQND